MELLIVLLVVIGFVGLVFAFALGAVLGLIDEVAGREEADPYREGLDASARISAMAFEAERLMHHAAQEVSDEES